MSGLKGILERQKFLRKCVQDESVLTSATNSERARNERSRTRPTDHDSGASGIDHPRLPQGFDSRGRGAAAKGRRAQSVGGMGIQDLTCQRFCNVRRGSTSDDIGGDSMRYSSRGRGRGRGRGREQGGFGRGQQFSGETDRGIRNSRGNDRGKWRLGESRFGGMNKTTDENYPQFMGSEKREDSHETIIGYKILKSWSETEDSEELLFLISNKLDPLQTLLMKSDLKADWLTLLVKALTSTLQCQTYTLRLKRILRALTDSQFFTQILSNHLDQKQEQGMLWKEATEFIYSILRIIQNIVNHLPDCAQKCKLPLFLLQSKIPDIKPLSSNQEIVTEVSSVLSQVSDAHKRYTDKQANRGFTRPTEDSESPPEDFTTLSIIPTVDDLNTEVKPFLRAVISKGKYRDQSHYLDVQFRLMREDFLKPLRKGIEDYKEHGSNKKFKSSEIRIYHDVHFTGMTHVNGIEHVLQFDVKELKHVKWDQSKRLLNGNLVCLSRDNFNSDLIFATVSFRHRELLEKGNINIVCHSGLDIVLKSSSSDSFQMLETMAYFEAVHPILRGLQNIESDLPFKEYIVSCSAILKPPSYLLGLGKVCEYDIGCLMKDKQPITLSILNTQRWPPAEMMCLNPSQREAAMLTLTKEIAVIQGPPGTGKTYVGLKVMQVLLSNQNQMAANENRKTDPILVICYTNHALDQFLEGILEFCKEGIVRIGGKCSKKLEHFNLKNIRRNRDTESGAFRYSLRQLREKMRIVSEKIDETKKQIDSLSTDILDENVLAKCISENHFNSLQAAPSHSKKQKKMHQWLNVSNQSFLQVLPTMIKNHMVKLVLKSRMISDRNLDINQINPYTASVVERVYLYHYWLAAYQNYLRNLMDDASHLTPMDKSLLSFHYQQSTRPDVLNDSEIGQIFSLGELASIREIIGKRRMVPEDSLIATFVLGLHKNYSEQLDDVEKFTKYISKHIEANRDDDYDDDDAFDDSGEVAKSKKFRQIDDDVDDEVKHLNATLRVKNEGAYLLTRVKLLGISENVMEASIDREVEENEGFKTVTHKKQMSFSQVKKCLSDGKLQPVGEDEENLINDLWSLDSRSRFRLYKLWISRYRNSLIGQMETFIQDYTQIHQELAETRMKRDIAVLRNAKVIGMTTTGAAKNKTLLDIISCRIILVEEAAEVLEAHIVTALNKNCKHLILIGDHQQLRPNPTVYEHAKQFGLDVSLFERLINNEIPHKTLTEQHRMRESISKIMRHIYPKLQDHESVREYENIQGVSKNIFFIQHDHEEEVVKDSLSKSNSFEADYLIRLCNYLFQQGYKPSQITILATYAGQILTLRKKMKMFQNMLEVGVTAEGKKMKMFQNMLDVRATAVDNFQGEENDIILLSLVRSNEKNAVGFLKVDNRVCVALSRAKKGLFVIGNLKQMAKNSELWKKIIHTAEEDEIIGEGLPLSCPNHPSKKTIIHIPEDFDNCPEGGCDKKCDFRLDCGHTCYRKCHGNDSKHEEVECRAPCKKSCVMGHPCKKRCYQKCGDCHQEMDKVIKSCGHTNRFKCYYSPKSEDCQNPCNAVLSCGHSCRGKCGGCKKNGRHKLCEEKGEYFWPCGHIVEVACHYQPGDNPCPKVCGEVLSCGHSCKGKCCDCLKGAIHVACEEDCPNILPCGHRCQSRCSVPCPPCAQPCPAACRHSSCHNQRKPRTCGEPCIKCQEVCKKTCSHLKCSRKCFEECDVKECEKGCTKKLDCNHVCSGLCGELCVCKHCHKIARWPKSKPNQKDDVQGHKSDNTQKEQCEFVLKLPSCGHIFPLREIDEYVTTMMQKNSTEYICCPVCNIPIQKCTRYHRILQQRAMKREEKKEKLLSLHRLTVDQQLRIKESLRLLQDNDSDNVWLDWRYFDSKKLKTIGEIQAVSSKLKFAYAIGEIEALEEETSSLTGKEIKERISALLKVGSEMTTQQIKEWKLDLKRLLISRYLGTLKEMATGHVRFDESTSEGLRKVMAGVKECKPPAHCLEDGVVVMKSMEEEIKAKCSDSSVQATLVLKKRIARRALDVLNAEDQKMLSEIIGRNHVTVGKDLVPTLSRLHQTRALRRIRSGELAHIRTLQDILDDRRAQTRVPLRSQNLDEDRSSPEDLDDIFDSDVDTEYL